MRYYFTIETYCNFTCPIYEEFNAEWKEDRIATINRELKKQFPQLVYNQLEYTGDSPFGYIEGSEQDITFFLLFV